VRKYNKYPFSQQQNILKLRNFKPNPVYFSWLYDCCVLLEDDIVMVKHVGVKWLL